MPRALIEHAGVSIGVDEISKRPLLAAKVGVVAAAWAAAEMNLGSLFAELTSTEPRAALAILSRFTTATARSQAVRSIARAILEDPARSDLLGVLSQFDQLARRRNDVLHGLWGTTPSEPHALIWADPMDQISLMREFLAVFTRGEWKPGSLPFPIFIYESEDFDGIISEIKALNGLLVRWAASARGNRETGGLLPLTAPSDKS